MKQIKKHLRILLITVSVLFISCKPEFSVNDVEQDIVITYGILNVNETKHYIKIYKAFLTNMNTYEYIMNPDPAVISYVDSINVVMEEYIGETLNRSIQLDTTTSIPKDEGVFSYPTQILYVANARLNPNARYRLKITHKYSGKECYADANLVNDFLIFQPAGNQIDLTGNTLTCGFKSPVNGSTFEIYQIFRYIEVAKTSGEVTKHSMKRKISSGDISEVSTSVEHDINNIYTAIKDNVKENDNVVRYIDGWNCIDYEVWVAEKAFSLYIKANNQSSSVLNNKIDYTNFISDDKSAYGIFSSRNSVLRSFTIDAKSQDSLVSGKYTKNLGFIKKPD